MKALKSILLIAVLIVLALVLVLSFGDPKVDETASSYLSIKLYITYAIFGIAVVSMLGFVVVNLVTNLKQNTRSLLGVALIAGLIVLFYIIAPVSDVPADKFEKTQTSLGWSPIIGAGLYLIYTFLASFVLLLAFFGVRNLIK
jgi:hypothetical protein